MNSIFLSSKLKLAGLYLIGGVLYICVGPAVRLNEGELTGNVIELDDINITSLSSEKVVFTKVLSLKNLDEVLNNLSKEHDIKVKRINLTDGVSAHVANSVLSVIGS